MSGNAKAMVWASFIADALALGAHWVYDAKKLETEYGRIADYLAPRPGSYHPRRSAGQFTHYGDQTLLLAESVAARGGFDLDDFAARWRALFADYDGYFDGATKNTLARFEFGEGPKTAGSNSNDLAGAGRIAPLVCAYRNDPEALLAAAQAQTRMTHNNPLVKESAAFFARTALECLAGKSAVAAMEAAARADYQSLPVRDWLQKGLDAAGRETTPALQDLGQTCHAPDAFPAVVQIVARHETDLESALVDNVMAGGDSAGRGLLVGLVLGASLGLEAVPRRWIEGLAARDRIEAFLAAAGD